MKCAYNSNAENVSTSGAPSLSAIRPHSADPAALKSASGNAHTSRGTHVGRLCIATQFHCIQHELLTHIVKQATKHLERK